MQLAGATAARSLRCFAPVLNPQLLANKHFLGQALVQLMPFLITSKDMRAAVIAAQRKQVRSATTEKAFPSSNRHDLPA